jgi:hypothetical protein
VSGLDNSFLEQFFGPEDGGSGAAAAGGGCGGHMSAAEKWEVVRSAAEQVLQVRCGAGQGGNGCVRVVRVTRALGCALGLP